MFDLAWSEIALIAVVALVVIGPKDLPGAIRGVADGIRKLRRMAGEFQQQADELVKEAKLDELRNQIQDVRSSISDIRNFDIKGQIEKTIDKDGVITKNLSDPLVPSASDWKPGMPKGPPTEAAPHEDEAPDFVPPSYAPPPPTPAVVSSAPPPSASAVAAPMPPSA